MTNHNSHVLFSPSKRQLFRYVIFCVLLLLCGCTEVTTFRDLVTLRYKAVTVACIAIGGVVSILLGIYLLTKVLQNRGAQDDKLGISAAMAISVMLGIFLLVLSRIFSWYRIEVSSSSLMISEYPESKSFSRAQVENIAIIPGRQGDRIRISVTGESEYFINEAEIGSAGFLQIKAALKRFEDPK